MAAKPALTNKMINQLWGVVLDYTPGIKIEIYPDKVESPDRLFIGLFGLPGSGKTSLINSIKFSVLGQLRRSQWYQAAPQEMTGAHTMRRMLIPITKSIFVIDNRGGDLKHWAVLDEFKEQLDGNRGYSQIVEWEKGNAPPDDDLNEIKLDVKTGHPIGCAVIVLSALHYTNEKTNESDMTDAIQLRDVAAFFLRELGCYPVAVITHVDVAQLKVVKSLKTILRSSGVTEIFEVANLTDKKTVLEEHYRYTLLSMLERCMTDGDETIIFKDYLRKDKQRKLKIDMIKEEQKKQREDLLDKEIQRGVEDERRLQEAIRNAEAEKRREVNEIRQKLQNEQRARAEEAERARADAERARADAEQARADAEQARAEAEQARAEAVRRAKEEADRLCTII